MKILVVDDELPVRESFKMILGIKDYDVFAFPDGTSAIASLDTEKYDAAFVDLKLKVMDGIEVLKAIKAKDPTVEVVIVTAYATESSHANAITFGALEYLRKPFLMEEIYELVERARKRREERAKKKTGPPKPPPEIH
ncbi:MAG: response regulator [Candidatus Saganbacteria bacterium]|nr:response regulator [Candidatus Saganbacteria bacterium]